MNLVKCYCLHLKENRACGIEDFWDDSISQSYCTLKHIYFSHQQLSV